MPTSSRHSMSQENRIVGNTVTKKEFTYVATEDAYSINTMQKHYVHLVMVESMFTPT